MSTEAQRAKWREDWKKRYADPAYREKRLAWAREKWQSDPAFREKDRQRRERRRTVPVTA